MYEEYFGFSGQPFKLNPDPKFFYGSQSHNKAMAYLHYGLRQNEGFIVITGEIGAGKSMLIGHLLDQIDRSNVVAADLITPNLKREDLLAHILSAYRIEPANDGPTAEIEAFEDYLYDQMNRGRRVLLIVDEAQNLPVDTLEELRVLSNLDYDGTPLFQVFLVGQPEFKKIVSGDGMEQLRQRIIASYHLEALNEEETRSYIDHRLRVVGWNNQPLIKDEAYFSVHAAAGGLPRNINKLFNRILLFCALEKHTEITSEIVKAVVDDLADEDVSGNPMLLVQQGNDELTEDTSEKVSISATQSQIDGQGALDDFDAPIDVVVQGENKSVSNAYDADHKSEDNNTLHDDGRVAPEATDIARRLPPPVSLNGSSLRDKQDEDSSSDIKDPDTDNKSMKDKKSSRGTPVLRLVSDRSHQREDEVSDDPFSLDDTVDLDVDQVNRDSANILGEGNDGAEPFAETDLDNDPNNDVADDEYGGQSKMPLPTSRDDASDEKTEIAITDVAQHVKKIAEGVDVAASLDEDHKTAKLIDETATSDPQTAETDMDQATDIRDENTEEKDDSVGKEISTENVTVPVAPVSVLDRIRREGGNASKEQSSSQEKSVEPIGRLAPEGEKADEKGPQAEVTIKDVAQAIAEASTPARASDVSSSIEEDGSHAPGNKTEKQVAADKALIEALVAAPLDDLSSAEDKVSVERWREALARTAAHTQMDLKEAQKVADQVRDRLKAYSDRDRATRDKVAESISRAKAILSELRDTWK